MKKFVIITKSDSGDDYIYFIEHETTPTFNEVYEWLRTNGSDVDEDGCYEDVELIVEIKDFKKLK